MRLEFADAEAARQCTISIDGDDIRIENLGEPIKLRPGKHQLRILHGDLEIETREFDVLRHGAQVLHVSIPAAAKSEPAQPDNVYARRGRAHYDEGEFSQAIAEYSEAIRLEPKVAAHYLGRGEAYAAKGEPDRALADFDDGIRLDPTSAEAWVNRGMIHLDQGQIEDAEAEFKKALWISPECSERYHNRAAQYLRNGNYALGFLDYRKAMRLKLDYEQAWARLLRDGQKDKDSFDTVLRASRDTLRSRGDFGRGWLHWASCWFPAVTRFMHELPRRELPGVVFVSDTPWVRSTCGWAPDPSRPPTSALRDLDHFGRTLFIAGLPYAKGVINYPFGGGRPGDVVVDVSGRRLAALKTHVGLWDHGSVQFQVLVDGTVKHETPVIRFGTLHAISVDVAGAKEVVLRVLGGGEACWGYARFVEAGAEDPLEAPPAELQSATDANAALFLAEVHWRLDHKDLARRWFDKAAAWMDKHPGEAEKLRAYRAEAAKVLGGK